MGRKRIYTDSKGAPQMTVRMPPDLLAWVKGQGGAAYLRRLAEEARAKEAATEARRVADGSYAGKVRVHEMARELGFSDSAPLLKILRDMGYEVKTASNVLPNEAVRKIREVVAPHIEMLRREAAEQEKGDQA